MPKPDQTLYDVLGVKPDAKHHEIYLSDARRTLPAKLKTILRQPVRVLKAGA